MKKGIIYLLAVLILIPQVSYAEKIFFKKHKINKKPPKIHPLQKIFNKVPKRISKSNKVLCLMIDFQEDDDPLTTGNGKFLKAEDAQDYPITLGKPPHDYNFYMEELEALRHYYLAASFGAFNMDYHLFPKPESGKVAYTLPHEMGYYNPPNASQELMIQRFEQYFTDIFTQADKDNAINFADYGHFLVIHAGSDWQHDIMGDTPSDIPSFFIKMAEDKKVWVDNHTVAIDHTCNVPEMITQDIQTLNDENGNLVYFGYGVVNAVMAHEFGHSLGFVDLYSTTSYRPGVGVFDIMDNGGSGLLGIQQDNTIYYVEGGLPVLPSAWHRILAWEDNFRARGILKDIYELPLNQDITLNPAEKPVSSLGDIDPYFIKVPITDKEYYLMENRQIDPDGDGGTAVKSTSDKRVILYPIHYNDDPSDTLATYEYDFLLPGWMTSDSRFVGGGILVWHINDKIIYDEGNYDTNTVNKDFYHRGVQVVEADNIIDIGNIHARYWNGTSYEPYFRYKPLFQNGYFVGWNDQVSTDGEEIGIFNKELSSYSKPPLKTRDDRFSELAIYDISSYPLGDMQERTMSFKIGINHFENTDKIDFADKKIKKIGAINKVEYIANEDAEFPVITKDGMSILSLSFGNWLKFDVLSYNDIKDVQVIDYYDDSQKYMIVRKDKISIFDTSEIRQFAYSDTFFDTPIYIKDTDKMVVPTTRKLYIGSDSLDIPKAKCYYDENSIIAVSQGKIYYIDKQTNQIKKSLLLDKFDCNYDLVTFVDTIKAANTASFTINKDNEIVKITENGVESIFSIKNYTSQKPSQLALFKNDNGMVYLVCGAGDRVFAVTTKGTLLKRFPATVSPNIILPYSYPHIILEDSKTALMFDTDRNYILAVGLNGYILNELSRIVDFDSFTFGYSKDLKKFFYIEDKEKFGLLISEKSESDLSVLWNGKRNLNYSVLYSSQTDYLPSSNDKIYGYAFPNPVKNGFVKFRVHNVSGNINLKIYDAAGNKIYKTVSYDNGESYHDITVNVSRWSSGTYFGIVKTDKKNIKIPFAIEK